MQVRATIEGNKVSVVQRDRSERTERGGETREKSTEQKKHALDTSVYILFTPVETWNDSSF